MADNDDMGYAPELTGAAAQKQRIAEHARDDAMHTAPQQDNPDPGPKHGHSMGAGKRGGGRGTGVHGYGHASGMEAALAAHADKVHPVSR